MAKVLCPFDEPNINESDAAPIPADELSRRKSKKEAKLNALNDEITILETFPSLVKANAKPKDSATVGKQSGKGSTSNDGAYTEIPHGLLLMYVSFITKNYYSCFIEILLMFECHRLNMAGKDIQDIKRLYAGLHTRDTTKRPEIRRTENPASSMFAHTNALFSQHQTRQSENISKKRTNFSSDKLYEDYDEYTQHIDPIFTRLLGFNTHCMLYKRLALQYRFHQLYRPSRAFKYIQVDIDGMDNMKDHAISTMKSQFKKDIFMGRMSKRRPAFQCNCSNNE